MELAKLGLGTVWIKRDGLALLPLPDSPGSTTHLCKVSLTLILSGISEAFITLCSMISQERIYPLNPNRELHENF